MTAKDLSSNKEASVRIEQSSGLSETEIERMRKDAESHAADDKKKVDLANARNQADHLCYTVEKSLTEHAEKLSEADKEPMERAVKKVREASAGEDIETIQAAIKELEQAQEAWSKVLYEKAGAGAAAEASDQGPADDDAIDAEFEVKKD